MTEVEGRAGGRTIMVAVDGGEESTFALQWCLKNLYFSDSDRLVLAYARTAPPVYSALDGAGYMFSEDVTASLEKYSRDLADSVIEKARNICKDYDNVKLDVKVAVGDARDVICEIVEKINADILVMGTHGYGFIQRALIGSVSDHCARHAKCPVLIVKRPPA